MIDYLKKRAENETNGQPRKFKLYCPQQENM